MEAVTFASYGTPTGGCARDGSGGNTFAINASCHANNSQALVEQACLGRHACAVPRSGYHDPCRGVAGKHVAAAVRCNDTGAAVYRAAAAAATAGEPLPPLPTASDVDVSAWVVRYPWDDTRAGAFHSSDDALDEVFAFCAYTIKATNLDMWTDSNTRQRDVLCNEAHRVVSVMQYAVAPEWASQRATSDYILGSGHAEHSFAEWRPIAVSYAWNDYMHTGNLSLARSYYAMLANYTLRGWIDPGTGLINTSTLPNPEIDWPPNMRDGFAFAATNTIVTAYAARASLQMADLARALGRADDAAAFGAQYAALKAAINAHAFNGTNAYCDGVCSDPAIGGHTAWHTSVFVLAFDLVEDEARKAAVWRYVRSRLYLDHSSDGAEGDDDAHAAGGDGAPVGAPTGNVPKPSDGMPGNVYSAVWALEALYSLDADRGTAGHALMVSENTNTWRAMLRRGATTTSEAWTPSEKPNLTWSHPWGAAPAGAIPRLLMGITPLAPGFASVRIKPMLGNLTAARYRNFPTVRGALHLSVTWDAGTTTMAAYAELPGNVAATFVLPTAAVGANGTSVTVCVDSAAQRASLDGLGNVVVRLAPGSGARKVLNGPC